MCSSMRRPNAAVWIFRSDVRKGKGVECEAASMRGELLKCAA
jgi:hypothetical protein